MFLIFKQKFLYRIPRKKRMWNIGIFSQKMLTLDVNLGKRLKYPRLPRLQKRFFQNINYQVVS